MATIFERVQQFNQMRDPQLVALKYQKMQADQSAFTFLRGTCHLFYEDWPTATPLNTAPLTWISGDLHLENFGTYKGDNRLTYFDVNDFDEAALAPCTWELARFLTSVLVAAQSLDLDESSALTLCDRFLQSYTLALAAGQARTVERETATGMVKDLLVSLKRRDRKSFLDERTTLKKGQRKLILDRKHTAIPTDEKNRLIDFTEQWRLQQPNPAFFKVLDLTHRIAGTGSLGIRRYALLVEGNGSPHQNYLLDLKAQSDSALAPYLKHQQPVWDSPAQRVASVQQRIQGMPPALLDTIAFDGQSFLLKELQPTQDRLSLGQAQGKVNRLEKVMMTMGNVVAWGQLRSSGRQGSADSGCVTALEELAIADELITFAQDTHWHQPLLAYARAYSHQVRSDYRNFCKALAEANP
jgi:uncharacterized protein (DUF2252 family)